MNKLLYVFLRGAVDGLSVLTPPDAQYRSMRPDLATPEADLLPLSGGWSLHPKLVHLHRLVTSKNACIAPAVGMMDGSRSHFAAQHEVEVGGRNALATGTGWLGRHLAATSGSTSNPLRALSIGAVSLPASLRGTQDSVAALTISALTLGAAPFPGRGGPKSQQGESQNSKSQKDKRTGGASAVEFSADWFDAVWNDHADSPVVAGVNAVGRVQTALARSTAATTADNSTGTTEADPPDERQGAARAAFAEASRAFNGGFGTEIVMLNLGGWDTHNAQGTGNEGQLATLLGDLDQGLQRFLDTHAKDRDPITVLIVSEFGRRVQQNSSLGTDHGKGGIAIVAGAHAAGGVVGKWPGLADLDDGDVRVANPTTQVLGEVAKTVLSTPVIDDVVPGVDSKSFIGMCA